MLISAPVRPALNRISALLFSTLLISCGGTAGDNDPAVNGSSGSSAGADLNVPVLSDNSFLLGNSVLGDMHRYDPISGTIDVFSSPEDWGSSASYTGSVDISNNTIITVATDNSMVALDAGSGEYLWSLPLGDFLFQTPLNAPTSPVCAGDVCYAMSAAGDIVAVDVINRSTIWSTDLFPAVEETLDLFPLVVTEDKIFAGGYRFSSVFGDVAPQLFVVSRSTGNVEQELPDGWASVSGDFL